MLCLNFGSHQDVGVFPTCVGVFPISRLRESIIRSLPHMRGGVSFNATDIDKAFVSSPHAWGCFSANRAPLNH